MKKQLQSGEKLFIVTSVVESEKLIGTYPGAPVGAKDADLIRNAVQTLHPHLVTLEAAKEGNAISLSADPRLLWEFGTREVKLIDGKLTVNERIRRPTVTKNPVSLHSELFQLRRNHDTAVRIFVFVQLVVILMVVFGDPEFCGFANFRHGRSRIHPAFIQFLHRLCHYISLLGGMVEYDRTILGPAVRSLLIHRGRVVCLPEDIQDLLQGNDRRIKGDFDDLNVAGRLRAYLLIGRILQFASHVSRNNVSNALEPFHDRFGSPETSAAQRDGVLPVSSDFPSFIGFFSEDATLVAVIAPLAMTGS